MANQLNIDLKDKWVTVKDREKKFFCTDGFGCSPSTNGSTIFGYYEDADQDKEGRKLIQCISGYTVTGLAK